MVWITRIVLLFFLFFSHNIFSDELNDNEEMYFNFIDLDNDNQISQSEIDQSISLLFQLTDLNQDGFISKFEINELKDIINSLR